MRASGATDGGIGFPFPVAVALPVILLLAPAEYNPCLVSATDTATGTAPVRATEDAGVDESLIELTGFISILALSVTVAEIFGGDSILASRSVGDNRERCWWLPADCEGTLS